MNYCNSNDRIIVITSHSHHDYSRCPHHCSKHRCRSSISNTSSNKLSVNHKMSCGSVSYLVFFVFVCFLHHANIKISLWLIWNIALLNTLPPKLRPWILSSDVVMQSGKQIPHLLHKLSEKNEGKRVKVSNFPHPLKAIIRKIIH